MTSRLGSRGGTTASLDEARERQERWKAEWSTRIKQSIITTLQRKGTWHADDLYADLPELPADALNCIGAQVGNLVRRGAMREIARRRGTNPASHSRRSSVYEITETGRREIAGVSGTGAMATANRSADPGDAKAPVATVSAGDELDLPSAETLPLFDTPQAQSAPAWMDPDQRSAA
jgi:hypothetical protein